MADSSRVSRQARLRWVPIALMAVSPLAQREITPARVDKIAADFDVEQVGTPTVNLRNSRYYIIDGQHRIEAMKQIGWGDQQVQCWAYEGLTEAEEAETFLKLNDTLGVSTFAKFRVGVQAGRDEESDIDRIVRAQDLTVSKNATPGAISAVGTLRRVYRRAGAAVLARTLRIIRDAYGDAGLSAPVIDGVGFFCQRYETEIEDAVVVLRLKNMHAGAAGLLGKAEVLRQRTGNRRGHCVAAAIVDVLNAGRGGRKLAPWWREMTATSRSAAESG